MNEDSLKKIHISVLFDMMIASTTELINFDKEKHNMDFETKRKEIELLQRTIVARRLEFPPG